MAMVGAGCCRAPSAVMATPAALMRLGQRAPAAQQQQAARWWRRSGGGGGAAAAKKPWRAGFLGNVLGFGEAGNGAAAMEAGGSAQRLCVRAINVSGPGSVDSPLMQSMQAKIQGDLNAESVSVKDAYGDGRHVSIDVVASVFEGKSAVNRQRMVYKAIWEELQETVHAVDQLKTRTPSEAANSSDPL